MNSTGDEAPASSQTLLKDSGGGAIESTLSSVHTNDDIAEARRSGRNACTSNSSVKAPSRRRPPPPGTHASALGDRIQSLQRPPSVRLYSDAIFGNAPIRLAYRGATSGGTQPGAAP